VKQSGKVKAMSNVNGSNWIRKAKRYAIYARDNFSCCYCGTCFDSVKGLSLDHVVARENGGGNEATNLVTACISCNSRKGDMPIHQFVDEAHALIVLEQINKPINVEAGKRLVALEKAVK
jgi:5-methylcytosine-specific restriction endonuclease McrA